MQGSLRLFLAIVVVFVVPSSLLARQQWGLGVTLTGLEAVFTQATPVALVVSSNAGGVVSEPGEGTFEYYAGDMVMLQAKAKPLFTFVGWRNAVFTASNPYWLTMDANCIVEAYFESVLDTLYVDDDAPGDPGPSDPNLSDPKENGTWEYPFDTIQEAIDVARENTRVIVRSGTYFETIDLLGKAILVNGLNENEPNITTLPVIDGQGKDAVVTCIEREDPNCVLCGLVITGGKGMLAGGVICVRSSPTIVNCLIIGNRVIGLNAGGGGVYCQNSNAAFINCTISGNYGGSKGAGLWFKDSAAIMTNSIVWDNTPAEAGVVGAILPVIVYSNIAGGWPDSGNLKTDPLFASLGYWADPRDLAKAIDPSVTSAVWVQGDFHLMSQAGRWDPTSDVWVADGVNSPCIDTGDPVSLIGNESSPNGGRVNMGAYGGTRQASRSP